MFVVSSKKTSESKKMKVMFFNLKYIVIALLLVFSVLMVEPSKAFALTASELNNQLQELINRSNNAKKQATTKKQEAALIEEQIGVVEGDIAETESAINSTENQISLTEKVISQLDVNIANEEENLSNEKNRLGQLIASWYMEKPKGLVETLVGSDTVSEVVTRQQYFESIRNQITDSIDKITSIKTELNTQKDQRTSELVTLQGLKNDQEVRKDSLESKRAYKSRLLSSTENAIEALTEEAAKAEKQAEEVRRQLDSIFAGGANCNRGSDLITNKDYRYYYSQKNYPDTYMSPSRLTISSAGCLITSIAMIATYYGKAKTPPDIAAASYFNYSGGWQGFKSNVGISVSATQAVNWDTINSELANKHPVAVGVVFPGRTCSFNSYGVCHWIVIRARENGKYLIHDPGGCANPSYAIYQVRSMKIIRPY